MVNLDYIAKMTPADRKKCGIKKRWGKFYKNCGYCGKDIMILGEELFVCRRCGDTMPAEDVVLYRL